MPQRRLPLRNRKLEDYEIDCQEERGRIENQPLEVCEEDCSCEERKSACRGSKGINTSEELDCSEKGDGCEEGCSCGFEQESNRADAIYAPKEGAESVRFGSLGSRSSRHP